jgi:hypothetical protein
MNSQSYVFQQQPSAVSMPAQHQHQPNPHVQHHPVNIINHSQPIIVLQPQQISHQAGHQPQVQQQQQQQHVQQHQQQQHYLLSNQTLNPQYASNMQINQQYSQQQQQAVYQQQQQQQQQPHVMNVHTFKPNQFWDSSKMKTFDELDNRTQTFSIYFYDSIFSFFFHFFFFKWIKFKIFVLKLFVNLKIAISSLLLLTIYKL